MLDREGFDVWAADYDGSVARADRENRYPFAGYAAVLSRVYDLASARGGEVLDVGVGTGVLAARLERAGCRITGLDFSPEMLRKAGERLKNAELIEADFTSALPSSLECRRFDSIVCTYALHHAPAAEKPRVIRSLCALLKEGGALYVGDVAFERRALLARCREEAGKLWDFSEEYIVTEELAPLFPEMRFEKKSFCAGVFVFPAKQPRKY